MNDFAKALERLPSPAGDDSLKLLAMECTEKTGSVGLMTPSGTLFLPLPTQYSTARSLAPAIRELFNESGLSVKDLNRICVTCGPGSFTGLRIGIGLARAMAFGSDVPLSGVSSLATLASDYAFPRLKVEGTIARRFVTVLNAYRNEIFVAAWSFEDQELKRLSPDSITGRPGLADWAKQMCDIDDVAVVSPEAPSFFGTASSTRISPTAWGVIRAALFQTQLLDNELDEVLPTYLRRSAAEEKRSATSNMAERS